MSELTWQFWVLFYLGIFLFSVGAGYLFGMFMNRGK
jgi:hypothetical protein